MYCDNCRYATELTSDPDTDISPCDDCHRKNNGWGISMVEAERIAGMIGSTEEVVQYEDAIDRYSALAILDPCSVEYKEMKALPSVLIKNPKDMTIEALQDDWIPVSERLPECEQEVLICTEKKILGKDACIDSIITPAMYEDGTMLEIESKWGWVDIDFDEWDDTEDCGIIPEGWWENRHFNPDEVYNNPVDRNVVAWQPLPEPYKAGDTE